MIYNVGMYGGSFDPLHRGHICDVIRASSMCKELFVVISWCKGRESVSKEQIYRWMHYCTKHLTNVKIIFIEDQAVSKEEYSSDFYWENGAKDIKKAIGKKIDCVFCGSDNYGTNRFESLYAPESKVVYFDRSEVPISSTQIRQDPYTYWQYLPPICREYYAKRILIVGSESTGKSTLVENLAFAYNTNFVSEVGREVCEDAGGEAYMNASDLIKNFLLQKAKEMEALMFSNRLLFVDTDALTTKFYAEFLLSDEDEINQCNALADAIHDINRFDLVFFLEPTVDFVQDGTRNEEIMLERHKYSNQLKALFLEKEVPVVCLDGNYHDRFEQVKIEIENRFGIRFYT